MPYLKRLAGRITDNSARARGCAGFNAPRIAKHHTSLIIGCRKRDVAGADGTSSKVESTVVIGRSHIDGIAEITA